MKGIVGRWTSIKLCSLFCVFLSLSVQANEGFDQQNVHTTRFESHVDSSISVDEFGDSINPLSGELAFRVTDISLPGNSHLPVSVTRRLSDIAAAAKGNPGRGPNLGPFSIEVPYVTTQVFNPAATSLTADGSPGVKLGWHANRCDQLSLPSFESKSVEFNEQFYSTISWDWHFYADFFHGVTLFAPGSWGEQLMYPSEAIGNLNVLVHQMGGRVFEE
jgi:hypothetical protein